jgi:hypothetical protein
VTTAAGQVEYQKDFDEDEITTELIKAFIELHREEIIPRDDVVDLLIKYDILPEDYDKKEAMLKILDQARTDPDYPLNKTKPDNTLPNDPRMPTTNSQGPRACLRKSVNKILAVRFAQRKYALDEFELNEIKQIRKATNRAINEYLAYAEAKKDAVFGQGKWTREKGLEYVAGLKEAGRGPEAANG